MANVFLPIVVPATTGSGAALNVSALGYNKLFSLVGTFGSVLSLGATINIEASNDGVAWVPVATLNAANDVRRSFAAIFVRATVIGDATGATLSVGSDDPGTDMIAIPTPIANGTGAPVNLSTFGMNKTFIYNGAMEACITIEISQDGTNYTEAISFVGKTKAHFNLSASVEFARVRVSNYDGLGGVPTVSVCACKEITSASASLSPSTGTRFKLYVRPTGSDTTGTGTLANPYLTIPRALEDVPNIVRGGDRYVVEVSDYGNYNIGGGVLTVPEENYSLDPFVTIVGVDYAPFVTEAPITIQAVPTVVQAIPLANVVGVVSADGLGTKNMTTTLVLVPGALAGMFLVTGGVFAGVIYDNDATNIFFTGAGGVADYDVVQPSTTLINGSLLMSNSRCAVQFNGLGSDISGIVEKSVAPGFLMLANASGNAWFFQDNDGQMLAEYVYLGDTSSFTHQGHTNALYHVAATSLVGSVSITAYSGSSGVLQLLVVTLWGGTVDQGATGPVASLGIASLMLDCTGAGSGLWLRGGDNTIEGMYCINGLADAIPAVRLLGGRTVASNIKGTGQTIGAFTGPYGVLASQSGADGNGFGGGLLIDAISDVPGATSDLQIGSLAGRTWANFRAAAPIGIEADVGALVGQTQCYVRQP